MGYRSPKSGLLGDGLDDLASRWGDGWQSNSNGVMLRVDYRINGSRCCEVSQGDILAGKRPNSAVFRFDRCVSGQRNNRGDRKKANYHSWPEAIPGRPYPLTPNKQ